MKKVVSVPFRGFAFINDNLTTNVSNKPFPSPFGVLLL